MPLNINLRKTVLLGTLFAFLTNGLALPSARAQEVFLPAPGTRISLSPAFNPPVLKGLKVHPDNPFRFDFILDKGDSTLANDQLKDESSKLIKYFLASLTVPEKDLWVNLSPYEKDRIVPQSFGQTEMGRDLLAQDYLLKQITASLIYPEDEFGKIFWNRVYQEANKRFGTTNIPVNTFNKVWIVPEKAVVYENAQAGTAYVVESRLKVMLEQDYLALERSKVEGQRSKQQQNPLGLDLSASSSLGSQIVREIVIPQLTKEINEGKNFAQLRQVYNSLILATWYKKKIKDSILNKIYADRNKVAGVQYNSSVIPAKAGIQSKGDVEGIYQQYLQAFKKGVYNYIKEEQDPITQQMIPRKYFSGGFNLAMTSMDSKNMLEIRSIYENPAILSKMKFMGGALMLGVILANAAVTTVAVPTQAATKTTAQSQEADAAMTIEPQWNEGALTTWLSASAFNATMIPSDVMPKVLNILNGNQSGMEKRGELSLILTGLGVPEASKLAYELSWVSKGELAALNFKPQSVAVLDLSIEHMVNHEKTGAENALKFRKEIELSLGRVRGNDPVPGFEPFLNEDEVRRLAGIFAKKGLGSIFSDGLSYVRSYHPTRDDYSSHNISYSGVYARENKGSSKLILVSQIILSDIPKTMPERAHFINTLNATLYANMWLNNNPGTMDELHRELPLLGQTIQASLDSFMSRRLPKADEHSAKRLMETLFFHEIGEILYQTLPVTFKNEWRELLNTPGSRPLPGIIAFKDNFKALTQASTGMGPIDAAPEFFADYFAMFFYPDNVYSAYGEPFRDGWKRFMEKTRAYLLQKQRQGRNILEIDDSNLVDTVIQNETFIMQDDLQVLFDKLASSAGDSAQLAENHWPGDRAMAAKAGQEPAPNPEIDRAMATSVNKEYLVTALTDAEVGEYLERSSRHGGKVFVQDRVVTSLDDTAERDLLSISQVVAARQQGMVEAVSVNGFDQIVWKKGQRDIWDAAEKLARQRAISGNDERFIDHVQTDTTITKPGHVNEDTGFVSQWGLAVADGVGNGPAGEVASQEAIAAVRSELQGRDSFVFSSDEKAKRFALGVFQKAEQRIINDREMKPPRGDVDMKTTLAFFVIWRNPQGQRRVVWVNVGNSGLGIRKASGEVRRLGRDDSFVARAGFTEAQAKTHPLRHVIVDFLGGKDRQSARGQLEGHQISVDALDPDDILVGFSDGIINNLGWEGMAQIIARYSDPIAIAKHLMEEAKHFSFLPDGTKDDMTAVARQVPPDRAMAGEAKKGGIDLNAVEKKLQTQNINGEIKFHIDPAMLEQLQNAPGFVPVIIDIQPMTDLRVFLGLQENQDQRQASVL